jgi:hypothetical protein
LLAAAIGLIAFGLRSSRYRFVRSNADMVASLPPGEGTVFFLNMARLREANLLNLIADAKPVQEDEYRRFVRDSGFDYTRDVDSVAGAAGSDEIFALVRARFDWIRLRSYVIRHGGSCQGELCDAATRTGRWVSFHSIQPDVMALAVSDDKNAATKLSPRHDVHRTEVRSEPLWVTMDHRALQDLARVPPAVRIFAMSLQGAASVTLAAGPDAKAGALQLRMEAPFGTGPTAQTMCNQLEIQTKMLKLELARSHQQANPADLSGLLVSGTFQAAGSTVIGTWPLHREFLDNLR